MRPCKVVGLETVTWKCNWNCKHCFFRRFPEPHQKGDTSLDELKREIDEGKKRGCNAVSLCGKGEPMLHREVDKIIEYCTSVGMRSSVITNGDVNIEKYQRLFDLGLGHVQLSMHGTGKVLDEISERKEAGKRQWQFLEWLNEKKYPFRINITVQQANYHSIPDTAMKALELGAFHISLLNFLPHYHWREHVGEAAVHPVELVPYLQRTMHQLEGKVLFTLRYFPMCPLQPKFWKYVTNARFVLFDPGEWDYGSCSEDEDKVWEDAIRIGEAVAIQGEPCGSCLLREHCGGWNRYYAEAFHLEGLKAIREIPDEYKDVIGKRGGLFGLNPANKEHPNPRILNENSGNLRSLGSFSHRTS